MNLSDRFYHYNGSFIPYLQIAFFVPCACYRFGDDRLVHENPMRFLPWDGTVMLKIFPCPILSNFNVRERVILKMNTFTIGSQKSMY